MPGCPRPTPHLWMAQGALGHVHGAVKRARSPDRRHKVWARWCVCRVWGLWAPGSARVTLYSTCVSLSLSMRSGCLRAVPLACGSWRALCPWASAAEPRASRSQANAATCRPGRHGRSDLWSGVGLATSLLFPGAEMLLVPPLPQVWSNRGAQHCGPHRAPGVCTPNHQTAIVKHSSDSPHPNQNPTLCPSVSPFLRPCYRDLQGDQSPQLPTESVGKPPRATHSRHVHMRGVARALGGLGLSRSAWEGCSWPSKVSRGGGTPRWLHLCVPLPGSPLPSPARTLGGGSECPSRPRVRGRTAWLPDFGQPCLLSRHTCPGRRGLRDLSWTPGSPRRVFSTRWAPGSEPAAGALSRFDPSNRLCRHPETRTEPRWQVPDTLPAPPPAPMPQVRSPAASTGPEELEGLLGCSGAALQGQRRPQKPRLSGPGPGARVGGGGAGGRREDRRRLSGKILRIYLTGCVHHDSHRTTSESRVSFISNKGVLSTRSTFEKVNLGLFGLFQNIKIKTFDTHIAPKVKK